MSLAEDTIGQFRVDPRHSGMVGKPNLRLDSPLEDKDLKSEDKDL